MPDWISTIIPRIDVPAWLQAFAAVVALVISVWGVLRAGSSERRRDRLEAMGLAVAIYPEIDKLRISLDDRRQRLRAIKVDLGNQPGQFVGANINSMQIEMPTMFDRNIDRLFMLGAKAGPSCLQLVNVLLQYNTFVNEISQRTMMLGPNQWANGLDQLDEHLTLLSGVIVKCECDVRPLHDAVKT
jgi:hypothetical protein